jgi:predicted Zn finger-like uncharacterized protein
MILTCPECATRYFVDDAKLGAEGRTVRCAGCGHRWRAQAEPDLELVSTPDEGAIAAAPAEAPAPPSDVADLRAEILPKVFRAKAVEKKSMRQAMVHGVIWAGMAAVLMALLGAAALFRVDIVRLIPRAAGAYATVGLAVNPTGLVFEGVAAHPALQDGHSALVVSGAIRNIEDRAVTAPALRIQVLDHAGQPVAVKIAGTENPHLKPGEVRHFVVAVLDPPATAHNVEVAFAFDEARPKTTAAAPKRAHAVPAGGHAMRGAATPEPIHIDPTMEIEQAQPLPADAPDALPEPAARHTEPHG